MYMHLARKNYKHSQLLKLLICVSTINKRTYRQTEQSLYPLSTLTTHVRAWNNMSTALKCLNQVEASSVIESC